MYVWMLIDAAWSRLMSDDADDVDACADASSYTRELLDTSEHIIVPLEFFALTSIQDIIRDCPEDGR